MIHLGDSLQKLAAEEKAIHDSYFQLIYHRNSNEGSKEKIVIQPSFSQPNYYLNCFTH